MTQSKGKGPDVRGTSVKANAKGKIEDHEDRDRDSNVDSDENPGEERAAKGGLGEMKLPANLIQTILSGASKSKEDLMGRVD